MIVQRLERPAWAAVDFEELKAHVRVDGDHDDRQLLRMCLAASREAEDLAQIALRFQAVRVTLDAWPRGHSFRLPIGPMLDWDGLSVSADGEPFEAFSILTGQYPVLRLDGARPCGRIVIEYVAGYGETYGSVPSDLVLAITDQAAAYYDERGGGDPKRAARSPQFARVVGRYRGVRI